MALAALLSATSDLAPALVIVAVGVVILAVSLGVSLGVAIIIATRQGRTTVNVNIDLGRSRRRPP